MIEAPLPQSATTCREWCSDDGPPPTGPAQTLGWTDAGWRVDTDRLHARQVRFVKGTQGDWRHGRAEAPPTIGGGRPGSVLSGADTGRTSLGNCVPEPPWHGRRRPAESMPPYPPHGPIDAAHSADIAGDHCGTLPAGHGARTTKRSPTTGENALQAVRRRARGQAPRSTSGRRRDELACSRCLYASSLRLGRARALSHAS